MFRNVISQVARRVSAPTSVRWVTTNIEASVLETTTIEKTINQVQLLGRVGIEPRKRGTEEHPVVIFSLATHTNYKQEKGEMLQHTEWHRVCVFKPGLRDSVFTYMKKGQRVMVTGRISYTEFKDDEGKIKNSTSVIAEDVIFFQS